MALQLSLSYDEQGDNKLLTITDTTGTYVVVDNETGWGTPNIDVTDIVISTNVTPGKYHLLLTITLENSSGVSTVYDIIHLYDLNGGVFTTAADLVFEITTADLKVSGVASGTSDDELTDGLYTIDYRIVDNDDHTKTGGLTTTSNYIVAEDVMVYGIIKAKVYNKLRKIPTNYLCSDCTESNSLKEGDFYMTYLYSIEASAYEAKTEELISMLSTLEDMVVNNSNIIW